MWEEMHQEEFMDDFRYIYRQLGNNLAQEGEKSSSVRDFQLSLQKISIYFYELLFLDI